MMMSWIVLRRMQKGLCLFPPKLKALQINSHSEVPSIEYLPETLESFECGAIRLKKSTEAGFLIPPRLLNLDVSRLMGSEGKDKIEILPFDIPSTLLSLNISNMRNLQSLPSLCLGSLRSIEYVLLLSFEYSPTTSTISPQTGN
jgi:hypothetical protein